MLSRLFLHYRTMPKIIGTHSGHFHCDEALAVWMLKQIPQFKDASLVRSRDPAKLAECDVVVDVGGVYDPEQNKYDHHQRGFLETFDADHKTKLSSAGLVYKHFGRELIATILGSSEDDAQIQTVFEKTYNDFVESLDANDNGISAYPSNLTPLFKESPTSLPSRVAKKNPAWNEKLSDPEIDARFVAASDMAGEELKDYIMSLANAWLPARKLVVDALERRFEIHHSGRMIALEQSCPWKEHLMELEKERGLIDDKSILYILYPENGPEGNWRIQCVPTRPEGFENRKSLPEPWRGFRDNELDKIANVDGCIFVHAAGFIGGNRSYQGALDMARLAVEM
ncbi:metal-dependent protein hydrolase [Radiomyces spectabilis]|uniref:metal-dependent protein hydrolase n=1 Tax=Radiomyces spectabilis TaxID=64574 RepID=UPI00221F4693|nr:metal-dependent protein hydrolase [Radiomyces spectabilis]KAI8374166.1 metal-dependent protein hydrolase [Radiomyces spectabilis]